MLQSGYKASGCGRAALWPSGQYAVVGEELGEGFWTGRVLIPVAGGVTEIFELSCSAASITFAASAESLPVSLSVIRLGTSHSFLALG